MWQQQMQMMESFHNDMIMMVQMFVAMHREHLASVRDELDRVEQLTRELSDLQAKLAEPTGSPETGPPAGDARDSEASTASEHQGSPDAGPNRRRRTNRARQTRTEFAKVWRPEILQGKARHRSRIGRTSSTVLNSTPN